MNNLLLLTISATVFTTYVAVIWIKYGVLESISDSYYYSGCKPWFTLAMFGTGIPISMMATDGILFFAGAGIVFVGAAPAFHQDMTRDVHFTGAVGGIILGMLSCYLDYDNWWVPVGFLVMTGFFVWFRIINRVWWIELLAFGGIFSVLLLNLI